METGSKLLGEIASFPDLMKRLTNLVDTVAKAAVPVSGEEKQKLLYAIGSEFEALVWRAMDSLDENENRPWLREKR